MDDLPPFRKPGGSVLLILNQHSNKETGDTNIRGNAAENVSVSCQKMADPKDKVSELSTLTEEAAKHHESGNEGKALELYKKASKLSKEIKDVTIQITCAFNLGSQYIATRKYKKGLGILLETIPHGHQSEECQTGDFYYNIGLCYEHIMEEEKALDNFAIASEKYENSDNNEMRMQSLEKCEELYKKRKHFKEAIKINEKIVDLLGNENTLVKAQKLCERFYEFWHGKNPKCSKETAEDCKKIMENHNPEFKDRIYAGEIWNDLGVILTQLQQYDEAKDCFAEGIKHLEDSGTHAEAVILQNAGAIRNISENYKDGIEYHEKAIKKYVDLKDSNGKGQCFLNLAFALGKLGEHKDAEIKFHHALQASKEIGDRHTRWHICENLGANYYNQGQKERAFSIFADALKYEQDFSHEERIRNKMLKVWCESQGIVHQTIFHEKPTVLLSSPSEDQTSSEDDSDDSEYDSGDDNEQDMEERMEHRQEQQSEEQNNFHSENEDEDQTFVKQPIQVEEDGDENVLMYAKELEAMEEENEGEQTNDQQDDDNKDQQKPSEKPNSQKNKQHVDSIVEPKDNEPISQGDANADTRPGEEKTQKIESKEQECQTNTSSICIII